MPTFLPIFVMRLDIFVTLVGSMAVQRERVCRAGSRLPGEPVYVPLAKTIHIFDNNLERVKIQSGNSIKGNIVKD